jgi:dephospho-CoA kinase
MSKNHPLKVGITGGIGAGKSTATKIFSLLGVPVYYADDRAKWLMKTDKNITEAIIKKFGEDSYLSDGSLNRVFLAETVFSNPEKVSQINSIVHPAVAKDFLEWTESQSAPYVLKEAALIFETEGHKSLDYVINVSSPLRIRISRVLMRDPHRTEAQVNQIIDHQLPDEQKNELADFTLKNTDNKLLIPQVLSIHKKLIEQSQKSQ